MMKQRVVEEVALADIQVGTHGFSNCRKVHADLSELKASIRKDGLLNPPIVWRVGDGLVLVSGHQRLAAIRELREEENAGEAYDRVLVAVYEGDLSGALGINVSENLQRVDLNAADKAEAVYRLVRQLGTQEKAAEAIGKSQPWVSHQSRIASNLAPLAMEALRDGCISVAQALVLASYVGPDGSPLLDKQLAALDEMLNGKKQGAQKKRVYRSKKDLEELRRSINSEDDLPDVSDARLTALRDAVRWYFMEIDTATLLSQPDEPVAVAAAEEKERLRA